jgi:hypothetical protein
VVRREGAQDCRRRGQRGNLRVRVLVHELTHALGVGYEQFGRERAEVIVDTVALIVCGSVGLDVGGESIPYVAAGARTVRLRRSRSSPRRSTRSRAGSRTCWPRRPRKRERPEGSRC